MLVTDVENPNDQYAFDNPCFREATPIKRNLNDEKETSRLEKNKWLGWSPLNPFGKEHKTKKITSMDDSCVNNSQLKVVNLKSHDFTGLGFNICGNMRDGIFIKDVLHRGPAFESGCINSGPTWIFQVDFGSLIWTFPVRTGCIDIPSLIPLDYANPSALRVVPIGMTTTLLVLLDMLQAPCGLIKILLICQKDIDGFDKDLSGVLFTARPCDRIDSVCISFRNMVFEDALTILSYASPYDVQVQVENDSYSRPSTLIRSKRESSMLSSVDKIFHPKYSRSQSISHLNEIGKSSNKQMSHRSGYGTQEKNRINQSLNKSSDGSNDYPTIKLTGHAGGAESKKERVKHEKNAAPRVSPSTVRSSTPEQSSDPQQNKHQKFGIKVLPMDFNPKGGDSGGKMAKEQPRSAMIFENEINTKKEKPTKPCSPKADAMKNKQNGTDEVDGGGRENVKAKLAKGFQNLKEKINQNTLGKKKKEGNDDPVSDTETHTKKGNQVKPGGSPSNSSHKNQEVAVDISGADDGAPKMRSSPSGVKVHDQSKQNGMTVPEEVSRAGDVARNNRKSLNDPNSCRKSLVSLLADSEVEPKAKKKGENNSDSENSTDGDSNRTADGVKKPKRSKGKAPPPPSSDLSKDGRSSASPKQMSASEINEIKRDADITNYDKSNSYEPDERIISLRDDTGDAIHRLPSYDSDSDTEPRLGDQIARSNSNKIELTSMQVTVHHSPTGDGKEDDIEPNRKAASLGDLSKLDSEQPLSIVLERAVSLDLADGAGQNIKKRKAPLPPSEEFPTVFDDYRKEPRLDSLGLNTFQRRLKKSSDFGTLEDALQDGPKSLEIEINKRGSSPIDLTEKHNSNIQEFSTWLAECRRPKADSSEPSSDEPVPSRISSTSLVNINAPVDLEKEATTEGTPSFEFCATNVSYSVNGKNFTPEVQTVSGQDSGPSSTTVVVISQPNSLEPGKMDSMSNGSEKSSVSPSKEIDENMNGYPSGVSEDGTTLEPFVTASESKIESFNKDDVHEEEESAPPKLPTSPMPTVTSSSTVSSPLSSTFTYITEIKVSTSQKGGGDESSTLKQPESPSTPKESLAVDGIGIKTSTPRPELGSSISKRIQQFDSRSGLAKNFISPIKTSRSSAEIRTGDNSPKRDHNSFEPSRIPIKTMKSETGQKVLATIQSLATKDPPPPKIPEVEYAKRVASLFSGTNSLERNQLNLKRRSEGSDLEVRSSNVTGFYLKGPETATHATRKVPPTVPPRKIETSLSTKSSVTVDLPGKNNPSGSSDKSGSSEPTERNIVTFSSFIPKNQSEESGGSTLISFKIK
ncbi:hypothetical protein RUM44_007112 [Polyplax serrata]|uniref:PDZ domain-containing protein n=1 Tax=Polyplax serrata TaxID=468196 RepID=A0ABR1AZS7_POLSC